MHICHITSVHPRYDIRIFIKECQTLSNAGYKVSLIVADGNGDEIKNFISIYDVGSATNRFKRMVIIPNKIFAKVLKIRPDVIHFHDPELMVVGRKLSVMGFKVVYDIHEDVPKQVLNKPWIPKIFRPIVSKLIAKGEQNACKQMAGVICATDIIANRLYKNRSKMITLHNYPILTELEGNELISWPERSCDLLYIGSISVNRGIVNLIESLKYNDFHLELAGKFSEKELENQLPKMGQWNKVNYHGIVDRAGIKKLLMNSKIGIVTLLPTPSYIESLPIKLFEYMLSEIPVVASNFPLWNDIVGKYSCGILVDPNDNKAIADACSWLINNPDKAMQMGKNGRKAVLDYFSWENESTKLINFYKQLM